MTNVVTIVACCYRIPPQDMKVRIQKLMRDSSIKVTGWVVSALLKEESDLGEGWTALPSDNVDFDFSAYFAGARAALDRGLGHEPVLFLNDTLFTDHAAQAHFRAIWRQLGLVADIELPAIAGKADPYTTVCLQNPWSGLGVYMTTFCFILNAPALPVLLGLRSLAEHDGVTHEHDIATPAWGHGLPPAFRQFLKAALVYPRSPYLWYRLRGGSYSSAQLRSKARCIYFEHRLSGAIGQSGCLLPANAGPRWTIFLKLHETLFRLRKRLGLSAGRR